MAALRPSRPQLAGSIVVGALTLALLAPLRLAGPVAVPRAPGAPAGATPAGAAASWEWVGGARLPAGATPTPEAGCATGDAGCALQASMDRVYAGFGPQQTVQASFASTVEARDRAAQAARCASNPEYAKLPNMCPTPTPAPPAG